MLELQEKENIEIVNMIYEIRGRQVMLANKISRTKGNRKDANDEK